MKESSGFEANSKRQAHDSIRGYAYQFWRTLDAWISLETDGFLFVEKAEDFDIINSTSGTAHQVKDTRRSGSLTLGSSNALQALNNFWELREKNPDSTRKINYQFLTTSKIGSEKGLNGLQGIKIWNECSRKGWEVATESIELIRCFLLKKDGTLSKELIDFIQQADDETLYENLIAPIGWATDEPSINEIQKKVIRHLRERGFSLGLSVQDAQDLSEHLYVRISNFAMDASSSPLEKEHLLKAIEEHASKRRPMGVPLADGMSDLAEQMVKRQEELFQKMGLATQQGVQLEGLRQAKDWLFGWPPDGSLPFPQAPSRTREMITYVERDNDKIIWDRIQKGHCVGVTGVLGMGGIGKTFLAMRVAEKFLAQGGHVVWVKLLRSDMEAALAEFASQFNLGFSVNLVIEEKCAALRGLLESHKAQGNNLLIVLDNAEFFEDVDSLVMACEGSPVLVTSRRPEGLDSGVQYFNLGTMSEPECMELCESIVAWRAPRVRFDSLPSEAVDQLREMCMIDLGGHPLGIRLAMALVVRNNHIADIVETRKQIQSSPLAVLDQVPGMEGVDPKLASSIKGTFDLIYKDLPQLYGEQGELAVILFQVLAAIAAVPIVEEDFWNAILAVTKHLNSVEVEDMPAWEVRLQSVEKASDMGDAIDILFECALLEIDEQIQPRTLEVHPLVREYILGDIEMSQEVDELRSVDGLSTKALIHMVLDSMSTHPSSHKLIVDLAPRGGNKLQRDIDTGKKLMKAANRFYVDGQWQGALLTWQTLDQIVHPSLNRLAGEIRTRLGDCMHRMEYPEGIATLKSGVQLWGADASSTQSLSENALFWRISALCREEVNTESMLSTLFSQYRALWTYALNTYSPDAASQLGTCISDYTPFEHSRLMASPENVLLAIDDFMNSELFEPCHLDRVKELSAQARGWEKDPLFTTIVRLRIILCSWRWGKLSDDEAFDELHALFEKNRAVGIRGYNVQHTKCLLQWEMNIRAGEWEKSIENASGARKSAPYLACAGTNISLFVDSLREIISYLITPGTSKSQMEKCSISLKRIDADCASHLLNGHLGWSHLAHALLALRLAEPSCENAVEHAVHARIAFMQNAGRVPQSAECIYQRIVDLVNEEKIQFEPLRDKVDVSRLLNDNQPWHIRNILPLPPRVRRQSDGRAMVLVNGGWNPSPPFGNTQASDLYLYPFYIDEDVCRDDDGAPLLLNYEDAAHYAEGTGGRLPTYSEWGAYTWQHVLGNRPIDKLSADEILDRIEGIVLKSVSCKLSFCADEELPVLWGIPHPKGQPDWRERYLEGIEWIHSVKCLERFYNDILQTKLSGVSEKEIEKLCTGLLNTISLTAFELRNAYRQLSTLNVSQVDRLVEIFAGEREKLMELGESEDSDIWAAVLYRTARWAHMMSHLHSIHMPHTCEQVWLQSFEQQSTVVAAVIAETDEAKTNYLPIVQRLFGNVKADDYESARNGVFLVKPIFSAMDMEGLEAI